MASENARRDKALEDLVRELRHLTGVFKTEARRSRMHVYNFPEREPLAEGELIIQPFSSIEVDGKTIGNPTSRVMRVIFVEEE